MKKAAKIILKNIPIFTRFIINKSLAEKEFNYKKIIFLTKKYNIDPVSIWENNYKFELDKQSVKHIEGGTWLPPHRLPPNQAKVRQCASSAPTGCNMLRNILAEDLCYEFLSLWAHDPYPPISL
jgi:hypothetical protein